ncbi:hypothetical protein ABZX90_26755 [Streptomyces sp. NPDC002935]|uniref:hypothetical protein n=1 Tax=unclassified Streptomyces TaxID=2593676 RepID=UPI00331E2500
MSPTPSATGRRRRILVPAPAESVHRVPLPPPPPPAQDPPIYRALMRTWADRGRTLPGRHDPEWARLAAPSVMYGYGQFVVGTDPRGEPRSTPGRDARGEGQYAPPRDPRNEFGVSSDPRDESG